MDTVLHIDWKGAEMKSLYLSTLIVVITVFFCACSIDKDTSQDPNIPTASVGVELSGTAVSDPDMASELPDHEIIMELFITTAEKLIFYDTEEPSYVLSSDFDHKIEIDGSGENKTIDNCLYHKTSLAYQQAVDEYSKLLTGNALNEFLARYFYNADGVLYVTAAGGRTGFDIKNITITFNGQLNGEYYYTATFDMVFINDESKREESQFGVTKIENDYRISSIDNIWNLSQSNPAS